MDYNYIQQSLCRTLIQILIKELDKFYNCRDHRAHRGLGLDNDLMIRKLVLNSQNQFLNLFVRAAGSLQLVKFLRLWRSWLSFNRLFNL